MQTRIFPTTTTLGQQAAHDAAARLKEVLAARGEANLIVATGASQFETLAALVQEPGIDWSRVTAFHLDEYIGMDVQHPASFRKYLRERFQSLLPQALEAFHEVGGDNPAGPEAECQRLGQLIAQHPIDVALIGIGENGHIAFNDPPADFESEQAYLVVGLDQACRQQQFGEGWFATLDDVPRQAISMSVKQILKARTIICSVPDQRKATAVKNCLMAEISPLVPSSILRTHADCTLYVDEAAASELDQPLLASMQRG